MNFSFRMPVQIFFEQDAVKKHIEQLTEFGEKAFIVTGCHSAKACGALDDVTDSLEKAGIGWQLFNQIENNPSVETIDKAAASAKAFGAQMIIGIGGGSPLDSSKAIAVLCAQADGNPQKAAELFAMPVKAALPVIAVPTTAGTGSEATQYSVLLRHDLGTKVSFGNKFTFPAIAMVDAKYTKNLPVQTTINTAVDACTHCLEGFVCNRSQIFTDSLALSALKEFGRCIPTLKEFTKANKILPDEIREKLMYVSLTGGVVIAHTGVTAVHGMGYCFTYFKQIPHGMANGFLTPVLLDFTKEKLAKKLDLALEALGFADAGSGGILQFKHELEELLGKPPVLTEEECKKYAELSLIQKGSLANTAVIPGEAELFELWKAFA